MTQQDDSERKKSEAPSLDDMLRALGIEPSVFLSPVPVCKPLPPQAASGDNQLRLSDDEWHQIAPLLPNERCRQGVLCNRSFVDAVLAAQARQSWTDHRNRIDDTDAVRRRFGRWAHKGIWQQLARAELTLSAKRRSVFAAIAYRAEGLRRARVHRRGTNTF